VLIYFFRRFRIVSIVELRALCLFVLFFKYRRAVAPGETARCWASVESCQVCTPVNIVEYAMMPESPK
jgi:hypothetical protein